MHAYFRGALLVSRARLASLQAASASDTRSPLGAIRSLIICMALMAGALAPSAALGQCSGTAAQFNAAGGMNALTAAIGTVNTAFLSNGSAFVSAPDSTPDQQGGGVWIRSIGGTVETQGSSNLRASVSIKAPPPVHLNPVSIRLSCNTKVAEDFVGFQAGH